MICPSLFNSSSVNIWAILLKVTFNGKEVISPVAIYFGRGEPDRSKCLNRLSNELSTVMVEEISFTCAKKVFVPDMPAKS